MVVGVLALAAFGAAVLGIAVCVTALVFLWPTRRSVRAYRAGMAAQRRINSGAAYGRLLPPHHRVRCGPPPQADSQRR